jgi:DNA-binding NarL/FixJ family response regulator
VNKKAPKTPKISPLTPRQKQILGCIMADQKDAAIAGELGIAYGTVRGHIEALFKKFHVQCRVGLVRAWFQNTDTHRELTACETVLQTKKPGSSRITL